MDNGMGKKLAAVLKAKEIGAKKRYEDAWGDIGTTGSLLSQPQAATMTFRTAAATAAVTAAQPVLAGPGTYVQRYTPPRAAPVKPSIAGAVIQPAHPLGPKISLDLVFKTADCDGPHPAVRVDKALDTQTSMMLVHLHEMSENDVMALARELLKLVSQSRAARAEAENE